MNDLYSTKLITLATWVRLASIPVSFSSWAIEFTKKLRVSAWVLVQHGSAALKMSVFAIGEHKARSLLCLGARWWHVSITCLVFSNRTQRLSIPSSELQCRLKFKVTARHHPFHCYLTCTAMPVSWDSDDVWSTFLTSFHSTLLASYHPSILRILISFSVSPYRISPTACLREENFAGF